MNKELFIIPFFLLIPLLLEAQNAEDVFDNYEFSQYITVSRGSPQSILKLDNNKVVIMALRTPQKIDVVIGNGVPVNESQLQLLREWDLLSVKDDLYHTSFPILGETKTNGLRDRAKQTAEGLGKILESDVIGLKNELESIGRSDNIYSILFSYVIDGQVWKDFENENMIDEREISIEHPFWDGEIWALYPKRSFKCGTNSISDKGVRLSVNWSDEGIKKMIPFVSDWGNLGKMFDNFVENRRIMDEDAKKVFAPYGLFNESGEFTIPVIEEKEGNHIFEKCSVISGKISHNILNYLDLDSITREYDLKDNKQTLVIIYHEIMWDLLDYFESRGIIKKPIIFSDPDKSQPSDVSSLTFFVISQSD